MNYSGNSILAISAGLSLLSVACVAAISGLGYSVPAMAALIGSTLFFVGIGAGSRHSGALVWMTLHIMLSLVFVPTMIEALCLLHDGDTIDALSLAALVAWLVAAFPFSFLSNLDAGTFGEKS